MRIIAIIIGNEETFAYWLWEGKGLNEIQSWKDEKCKGSELGLTSESCELQAVLKFHNFSRIPRDIFTRTRVKIICILIWSILYDSVLLLL